MTLGDGGTNDDGGEDFGGFTHTYDMGADAGGGDGGADSIDIGVLLGGGGGHPK